MWAQRSDNSEKRWLMSTQASSKKGAKQKLALFAIKYLCPEAIKSMVEKLKQKNIIKEGDKFLDLEQIGSSKEEQGHDKTNVINEELEEQKLNSKEKRKQKLKLKRKNQQELDVQKKVETELNTQSQLRPLIIAQEQTKIQLPDEELNQSQKSDQQSVELKELLLYQNCKKIQTIKTLSQQKELSEISDNDFNELGEIQINKTFLIKDNVESVEGERTVLNNIAQDSTNRESVKKIEFENDLDEPLFQLNSQKNKENTNKTLQQQEENKQNILDLCSENKYPTEIGEQPFVQKNFQKKDINQLNQFQKSPEIPKNFLGEKQKNFNIKKKQNKLLVSEDLKTLTSLVEVKQYLGIIENYFKQKIVKLPLSLKLNDFFKQNLAQTTKFLKFFIELYGYFDELEFEKKFEQDKDSNHIIIFTKKNKYGVPKPLEVKLSAKTMEQSYFKALLWVLKEKYKRYETMQEVFEQFVKQYEYVKEKEKENVKFNHKKLIDNNPESLKQISNNKELNNMFEDIEYKEIQQGKQHHKHNHKREDSQSHNHHYQNSNSSTQKHKKFEDKYQQKNKIINNYQTTQKKQYSKVREEEEPDYKDLARKLAQMKKREIEKEDNITEKCDNRSDQYTDNQPHYKMLIKQTLRKEIILID